MVRADSKSTTGVGGGDLYYPTDVAPEALFQEIGKLRKEARDEIDRLVRFLDKTDDYVSRELEDDDDREKVGDEEPDLGSFDRMVNQEKSYRQGNCDVDCELDDCDREEDDSPEESDTGIGDQDGLDEQVPFRDWTMVGMV